MDAPSIITLVGGITITILSAGATFFNKQRFVARIDLLQAGNDELRNQNQDLRNERLDLTAQLADAKARAEEKDKLIAAYKSQPNLTQLTKLISSNHKEIIKILKGSNAS